MFMHKSKKGFTIVELVIVIAVIAILAAVLIPTFSNLVKKANQSADIQAARQMNTVLAAEGAVEKNNIFEVYEALAANGMTAKDYRPLTTDHYFFWDDVADRIVYTDKNYQVIFPTDFQKDAKANWISLTAKIPTTKPASYSASGSTVSVATAEEYAYVVEQYRTGEFTGGSLTIDLGGSTIDMKGANVAIHKADGKLDKNVTITNGTIKNISSIDVGHAGNGGEHEDGKYYAGGLFASLGSKTVEISNVTIENAYIKSATTGSVGILAGSVGNKACLTIEDVTIKNSTVIGYDNVGALVGNSFNAGGPATIVNEGVVLNGDIELDNVQVRTAAGRSGLLIGFIYGDEYLHNTSSITLKNGTSYDIYECDLNTGSGLGLQGEELTSINVNGETEEHTFFADTYTTTNNSEYQDWSTGQAPIGEYKYTGNGFSGVTVE